MGGVQVMSVVAGLLFENGRRKGEAEYNWTYFSLERDKGSLSCLSLLVISISHELVLFSHNGLFGFGICGRMCSQAHKSGVKHSGFYFDNVALCEIDSLAILRSFLLLR